MLIALLACAAEPVAVHGAAAKGPLVLGSTVLVACIDDVGDPTGTVYATETTDDLGEFSLNVDYRGAVEVQAEGYSFDEIAATLTSAPITLRAQGVVTDEGEQAIYVNVVTHLAHTRVRGLLASGMTMEEATIQAERELRAAIAVGPADFDPGVSGTTMNLMGGDTDGNAYLFAVSAVVLQAGWRTATEDAAVAATTQALLNEIATDLADDGAIDPILTATLADAQAHIDPTVVMANLQGRFDALGTTAVVPDLTRVLGDGSAHPFVGEYDLQERAGLVIDSTCGYDMPLGPGDLDGDGFEDLVVAECLGGQVHVYLGAAEMDVAPSGTITGGDEDDDFGYDLDAGDVDGDGATDLFVGMLQRSSGGAMMGYGGAWVFAGPWDGARTEADAFVSLVGDTEATGFGLAVRILGDIDGAGTSALVVGEPFAESGGAVWIFDATATGTLSPDDAVASIVAEDPLWQLGLNLLTPGDVDGDGVDDLVVAIPNHMLDVNLPCCSTAAVYSGAVLGMDLTLDSAAALIATGGYANIGLELAAPGDVDGDGLADLLLGSSYAQPSFGEASALLYTGAPHGVLSEADATARFMAVTDDDQTGYSASGDVNDDGQPDFLFGGPNADANLGAAWLVYGPVAGEVDLADADARFGGTHSGEQAGRRVGLPGDLDGDHLDDVLVAGNASIYLLFTGA